MMNGRRNRYLEDRAMRRRDMARGSRGIDSRSGRNRDYNYDYNYMQDGRNPYGSRGGYVVSDRGNGNYNKPMDYGYDYAERGGGYDYRGGSDYRGGDYHMGSKRYGEHPRHMDYEMYGYGMITPMHQDYGRDYRETNPEFNRYYDQDYAMEEEEYNKKLKKHIEKLKQHDKFSNISKDQIIRQANNMRINFEEFSEEEFYFVYLMVMADYPSISNDYNIYIKMAKDWLESKTTKIKNSEKLCAYFYDIILGKYEKEEDDD